MSQRDDNAAPDLDARASNPLAVERASPSPRRIQPADYSAVAALAERLAAASVTPKEYRSQPAAIEMVLHLAAEKGLPPIHALQHITMINGRLTLWGDAMLAIVRASTCCVTVVETYDDEKSIARCETNRRGENVLQVRTFSREDAEKAGLWGRHGPWRTYPKRMLQMRARAFLLRDVYPDLLMGLGMTEEVADYDDSGVRVEYDDFERPRLVPAHDTLPQTAAWEDQNSEDGVRAQYDNVLEAIARSASHQELTAVAREVRAIPCSQLRAEAIKIGAMRRQVLRGIEVEQVNDNHAEHTDDNHAEHITGGGKQS